MSKDKFLEELEQKLRVLNEQERKDVLEEYAQHIDLKIENGLSEEDAVSDFGSPEALAAELLDAYHINCEYASGICPDDMEKKQENSGGIGQQSGRAVSNAMGDARNMAGQAAKGAGKAVCRLAERTRKAAGHLAEGTGKAVQNAGKGMGRICISIAQLLKMILEFLLGGIRRCGRAFRRFFCFLLRRPCPETVGLSPDMEIKEKAAQGEENHIQKEDAWKERKMQRQEKNEEDRRSKEELRLERRRIRNEEARERMARKAERRMRGERPLIVRGIQWCLHVMWLILLFCWKCCLVMAALPVLLLGLLSLFLAGVVFVLLMQGYPLAGAGMILAGMILSCMGTTALLLSWVFTGRKYRTTAVYAGEDRRNGTNVPDNRRETVNSCIPDRDAAGYSNGMTEAGQRDITMEKGAAVDEEGSTVPPESGESASCAGKEERESVGEAEEGGEMV